MSQPQETNLSPAPNVEQTADKAVWTSGAIFVVVLVYCIVTDKGAFTQEDLLESLGQALSLAGLAGGVTWAKKNKPKSRRR